RPREVARELLHGLLAYRTSDNRNAARQSRSGEGPRCVVGVNDVRTPLDQLRSECRKQVETLLRETRLQPNISPVDVAQIPKRLQEKERCVSAIGRVRRQYPDPGQVAGPDLGANASEADPADQKSPPSHSMTSSARARIAGGIVSPSTLAVARLT